MYVRACVCVCVCERVTGVQRRGPVRRTEFKFQIWSVSLGVTVCIALPAGPNSLHSDRASFFSSSLSFFLCYISVHLQRSPHLSVYLSSFLPSVLLSFSSLSKEGTSEPRFFILFKSEIAESGIDMRQRGRKKLESLGWLAFPPPPRSKWESHGAMFQDLLPEGLKGGRVELWSIL